MQKTSLRDWIFISIIVTLLVVFLSHGSTRPDATPALGSNPELSISTQSQVSGPSLAERAAFNALEEQLIRVYESTSPSVVHITNRSYDRRFGSTLPRGGTCWRITAMSDI